MTHGLIDENISSRAESMNATELEVRLVDSLSQDPDPLLDPIRSKNAIPFLRSLNKGQPLVEGITADQFKLMIASHMDDFTGYWNHLRDLDPAVPEAMTKAEWIKTFLRFIEHG